MIWNAYSEEKEKSFGISIKSAGHIFAKNGRRVFRPQGRADWLLFYVFKGKETFILDKTETADEGSFIIFKPGEVQNHFYEGEKTAEFYYVHFTLDEELPFELETSKIYNTKPSARIVELFEDILSELQLKRTLYEAHCIGKLLEIFTSLKRKTESKTDSQKEDFGKIAFVVQHIHKNYNKNESLDFYAELCALSKFHFLRKFEETTGMTPIAYKNKLRIDHAREMLEEGFLLINEISEMVGYSSPAYFSDAFKKETGFSPSEYKKQLIKNTR